MEKTGPTKGLPEAAPPVSRCHCSRSRFSRRIFSALFIVSAVSLFLGFGPNSFSIARVLNSNGSSCHDASHYSHPTALGENDPHAVGSIESSSNRVPLEAHVMSKCPDARHCLQHLVVPAMERIHDKVDFRLSFIGSISNDTSGVSCMHGPPECVGNMLILCAAHLPFPPTLSPSHSYPRTPTIRSLGFANCLISSYGRIPERELVESCALEHGIDFDALNQCASRQDDEEGGGGAGGDGDPDKVSGIALLRRSIQRNLDAGIRKSCTVRLDEQVWCVRDGGLWKDCVQDGEGSSVSVLAEEVERLWRERN